MAKKTYLCHDCPTGYAYLCAFGMIGVVRVPARIFLRLWQHKVPTIAPALAAGHVVQRLHVQR